MSERPTVSVVLPNYNHGHYLAGALTAILGQTASPLEVVVIDDGSTDDSIEVITAFAERDPRVHLHRNQSNRGVVYTLNRGARLAKGDFLYFTSSDDLILPRFLETTLDQLALHPEARLCCTDQNFLDDATGELSPKHVALCSRAEFIPAAQAVARMRRIRDSLGSSGVLIHRETLLGMGCFSERLRWHSDWFVVLAIMFRFGLCYVPEPLSAFRLTGKGFSGGASVWSEQKAVLERMLDALEGEFRDVAPGFHRSKVLANFGFGIVRAALGSARHRAIVPRLPFGAILLREVKDVLIRLGPHRVRRAFWALRYRWRRAGTRAATPDGAAGPGI